MDLYLLFDFKFSTLEGRYFGVLLHKRFFVMVMSRAERVLLNCGGAALAAKSLLNRF